MHRSIPATTLKVRGKLSYSHPCKHRAAGELVGYAPIPLVYSQTNTIARWRWVISAVGSTKSNKSCTCSGIMRIYESEKMIGEIERITLLALGPVMNRPNHKATYVYCN